MYFTRNIRIISTWSIILGASGIVNKIRSDPCAHLKCEFHSICRATGPNHATCECPTMCPTEYVPVCGSDGQVYASLCALKITACKLRKRIGVTRDGTCRINYYQDLYFLMDHSKQISEGKYGLQWSNFSKTLKSDKRDYDSLRQTRTFIKAEVL